MHAASNSLLRVVTCLLLSALTGSTAAVAADARYSNPEYGYSVRWPGSAPRRETEPPAPQHGAAIDLPSGGRIWVDGSYDASFQGSAKAALEQLLAQAGGKVTRSLRRTRLADLEAARASYTEAARVSIRVVAYRPRAQATAVLYTLGLDTRQANQHEDGKVFEKVLRSFAVTPLPE